MPTPAYNLPFPGLDDSPNGPQQIQDLAQAVEDTLQGDLELGGALEVPGGLDVGGNTAIAGTLTVSSVVNTPHSRMRPRQGASDEDLTSLSNTTPAPGDPVTGNTFEAPPSGMGLIIVTARVRSNFIGNLALVGWELRTGGTVGSGTVITAANANRAVGAGEAVVSEGPPEAISSNVFLQTGLTPASTYNFRAMHWCNLGAAFDVLYRSVLWLPIS